MSGLDGFSNNPLKTRADLLRATRCLIEPLTRYRSKEGARVKLRPATAAAFDDVAAQLEGFARPLWAISAILESSQGNSHNEIGAWIHGIKAGVDPKSLEYWGDLGDFDQRMVEMESIAFALLAAPQAVTSSLDEISVQHLKAWLSQINEHMMPRNNWRWFRIFVNLALVKVLGVSRSKVESTMKDDFAVLDEFYLGEGWSSDGIWGEERKQADYYSGSFAIQFAQLLYVRFAKEDEERVERYRQQAQEFAVKYWRYFDTNGTSMMQINDSETGTASNLCLLGAAIPYGRSLTYRFAFAAFWAAAAVAEVDLPKPMDSPGAIKGMLLRHIRWWTKYTDVFNPDGTMTIGFTYPNMYLSEDYNSRQSVYWCLKSFIILGLPQEHEFWTCDEIPHPLAANIPRADLGTVQANRPPRHILCSAPEHHFLLSSGQMSTRHFKAREAKYGKLAYSSAFAFSVPSGPLLHQMAPDSTLSVSLNDGETWTVRARPFDVQLGSVRVNDSGSVPSLTSRWTPFKYCNLEIQTTLIPLVEYFPGWHVRFHEVRGVEDLKTSSWFSSLEIVDASFAISAYTTAGYHVLQVTDSDTHYGKGDVYFANDRGSLIKSEAGASGIVDLNPGRAGDGDSIRLKSEGLVIAADPNTNLISQRTFIPSLKHHLALNDLRQESTSRPNDTASVVLVSGVFAISARELAAHEIDAAWEKRPKVELISDDLGKYTIQVS